MGQLKMAFENDYSKGRTIDLETGAYLECKKVCATHDEPGYYEFSFFWQGENIPLMAHEIISNTENPGPHEKSDYHWRFFQVGIPPRLKEQKAEILAAIQMAFETYGSGNNPRFERSVTAEFVPPDI